MGNPPDKYQAVKLSGDLDTDLAEINKLADQGYRFAGEIVAGDGPHGTYQAVIMGNYQQ